MRYRTLGRTGLRVSEVGVGGAQFGVPNYMGPWDPNSDEAERLTAATVHRALELGYTYFDTAASYGDGRSEEMVGAALKGHRDEIVLATKITRRQWAPETIRTSIEESLRRLQVDYVDVIQLHGSWFTEEHVDVILNQGGLEALERVRDEGKARFIGFTTEAPTGAVEKLIATGRFDTMQVRYNIMYQHPSDWGNDQGIIRQAEAQGMGIILMRPMTSGSFQRLMAQAFPEIDPEAVGRLLLNYVLSDPYVDVALIGMRDPHLCDVNNAISDDIASRLDLAALHNRTGR